MKIIYTKMQNLLNAKFSQVFVSLTALFIPLYPIMIVIIILVIFDFFTGLWASKKCGESITSRKMSNGVGKLILYNVLLLSAFLIETFIMPVIPLLKLGAAFIATVEFKSLAENANKIIGINIWDALKQFFLRRKDDLGDVFQHVEPKAKPKDKIKIKKEEKV